MHIRFTDLYRRKIDLNLNYTRGECDISHSGHRVLRLLGIVALVDGNLSCLCVKRCLGILLSIIV